MFEPSFNWHFSKPELYKHYFKVFSNQLREVAKYDNIKRYQFVSGLISEAIKLNKNIESRGIVFDQESGGSHLMPWLTAINEFAESQGWRK